MVKSNAESARDWRRKRAEEDPEFYASRYRRYMVPRKLCANCNMAKERVSGCPHQRKQD